MENKHPQYVAYIGFDQHMLDLVMSALAQLPFKDVNPIISDIQRQVAEINQKANQNKELAKAKAAKKVAKRVPQPKPMEVVKDAEVVNDDPVEKDPTKQNMPDDAEELADFLGSDSELTE